MQCPSCRAVYSNGLEVCPRCQTPASKNSLSHATQPAPSSEVLAQESASLEETRQDESAAASPKSPVVSTLIEFPGAGRANRPQWRKELSERVREIQERKARDAAREAEEYARRAAELPAAETAGPQIGLVPQPDVPAINPLVAAALRRIERAHQPPAQTRARTSLGGGAATAVARVIADQYQPDSTLEVAESPLALPAQDRITERPADAAREHGLVVVPAPSIPSPGESAVALRERAKRSAAKTVEAPLEETEPGAPPLADEVLYDDRGPLPKRFAAGIIDLLVVVFASSPFAAIIELTNGNWSDVRVSGSMGGIVLVIMFLYLSASTALAGRTWGMSLVSLRAVDEVSGLPPTTKQSVSRALLYMASLATAGLGILYAIFDAEGRAAHDHFSGTIVVRE